MQEEVKQAFSIRYGEIEGAMGEPLGRQEINLRFQLFWDKYDERQTSMTDWVNNLDDYFAAIKKQRERIETVKEKFAKYYRNIGGANGEELDQSEINQRFVLFWNRYERLESSDWDQDMEDYFAAAMRQRQQIKDIRKEFSERYEDIGW